MLKGRFLKDVQDRRGAFITGRRTDAENFKFDQFAFCKRAGGFAGLFYFAAEFAQDCEDRDAIQEKPTVRARLS